MTEKIAIITGAGRGLGRALALGLADFGALPILIGRNQSDIQDTKNEIEKHFGLQAVEYIVDLSNLQDIPEICDEIIKRYQGIDYLINNAAGWTQGSLDDLSDKEISDQINVTITASLLLAKHLKSALKNKENSHIVNIVSMGGLPNAKLGDASVAFYTSKYGQVGLGDMLRQEMQFDDIRVSNILPGGILSEASYFDDWEQIKTDHGSARMSVRDVVDAVTFVLSRSPLCSIDTLVISDRDR